MSNFEDKTPGTMEGHADLFRQTKNFAYAMSAFCRARENKHQIPEDILEFIEKSFLEWSKYDGEKSLDEILGIKPGKGKKYVLQDLWTSQRNVDLFNMMAVLIGLGWSVSDAAEGTSCWLRKRIDLNTSVKKYLKPSNAGRRNDESVLECKTLEDYWYSRKYTRLRREAESGTFISINCWTETEKIDYQKRVRKLMGKL